MSNEEFENYVALMGKLLQLTSEQREQISGELQDHLQMRVADLMGEGVAKTDAIRQALDEFGDVAVMAKNFQTVLKLKRRRWMMRFATYSVAGAFLAAVLTMAMWPDGARFGTPNQSLAQAESKAPDEADQHQKTGVNVSAATRRTRLAEETLKQVVSLSYTDTPFGQVEDHLEEITGLNFLLHGSASDDSLTSDEAITFHLDDMPLNKALNLMLETKNATYVIDEGVVVIISLDDAEDAKWFRLKMYDCRELVKALPKTQPTSMYPGGGGLGGGLGGGGGVFSIPLQTASSPSTNNDAQKPSTTSESDLLDQKLAKIMAMMKAQAEKQRPAPSSEQTLLDLVQNLIQPDSWQDSGQGLGQVKVVNGILVVSQTEAILQEIENFVADLEGNVLDKKEVMTRLQAPSSNRLGGSATAEDSAGDPFGSENPFTGEDP